MKNETYLGDGLYASHDGFQIVLRAPRERGDHFVCLDDATFQALLLFIGKILKTKITMEPVTNENNDARTY